MPFQRRSRTAMLSTAIVCALMAGGADADFLTVPANVLQYVPFTVSDPTSSLTNVRVMGSPDCASSVTGGEVRALSTAKAATFTITAETTQVWLCDGDSAQSLREIAIYPMSSTPVFAFRNTPVTLTFSPQTPVGGVVQILSFANCQSSLNPVSSATIDSSRQATLSSASTGFKCVTITAEATGSQVTVNTGRLLVTEVIGFSPGTVIFSDVVTFLLSGAAPPSANVRISRAVDCSDDTRSYAAGGQFGTTISTTIDFPRGTYQFCVEISSGVYASAGQLTVLLYSATPTTALRTRPTTFTLTDDSPRGTISRVTASADCSNVLFDNLLASPTTGQVSEVTFTTLGTFFLCVRTTDDANKFINAARIQVVPPADISFAPDPMVRGLLVNVNALPDPAMVIRLTVVGDCSNIFFTLTTSNNNVGFVMPTDGATVDVSTMSVCIVTADNSAVYAMRTVSIRNFVMHHEALVLGTRKNLTLDSAVTVGTVFSLSRSTDCTNPVGGASYTVADTSRTVYADFAEAGLHYICVQNTLSITSNVASVTVLPVPVVSPNASLTRQPTNFVISNTVGGALITIGSDCTTAPFLASGMTLGSTFSLSATFPTNGDFVVCATYKTSDNRDQVFQIGSISVSDMTSAPRYHVVNVPSSLTFSVPNADPSLNTDVNSNFFLTTLSDCNVVLPDTVPITRSIANFTPSATGTFLVCVQTIFQSSGTVIGNPPYIPAGTIDIIQPPPVQLVEAYAPVHKVPFHINVTGVYVPTSFTITTVADQCAIGTITTGLFDATSGVSATTVALDERSDQYSICVRSPDNAVLLWGANVRVTKFSSLVTSLVEQQPATVATTPTLSDPVTSYFLTPSSTCEPGSDRYAVANGQALTAPSGVYTLCAADSASPPTFTSPSSNNISVIEVFSAQLPSIVYGNVPVNLTVASDNTDRVRVYLLRNSSTTCNLLTDSALVGFVGLTPSIVSVTVPARTSVTVCAISNDGTVAMSVGTLHPLPYTIPFEIVKGTPTTLRSQGTRNGVVRLTTDPQCLLPVGPGLRTLSNFEVRDVLIPTTVTQEFLYFCEAPGLDDLTFTRIDTVGLLDPLRPGFETEPPATSPPNSTWQPLRELQQPGVPFNLTVDPNDGTNPYLSLFRNCSGSVNYTLGIFPAEGETASFYVCVTSPSGTVYTTLYPSMNFSNFQLEPTVARTNTPTRINLLPGVGRFIDEFGEGVYFSPSNSCDTDSGDLMGPYTTGVTDVVFTQPGRFWACLQPDPLVGELVTVASLMVHAAPVATVPRDVYLGVPVCVDLAVPNNTWSVTSGNVGPFTTRRVYLTTDPGVPASSTTLECSGNIVGEAITITSPSGVCIPTAGLNASVVYALCGPTPTGEVILSRGIVLPTVTMSPSQFVADADTSIRVNPNVSGVQLFLSANSGCTQRAAPTVTTAADGTASLPLTFSSNAFQPPSYVPFTAGTYYVCMVHAASGQTVVVTSVDITAPVRFGVSNTFFTTLIETEIRFTDDLRFEHILGFGEVIPPTDDLSRRAVVAAAECNTPSNTTATITPVVGNMQRARIQYTVNQDRVFYLCARAPVNGSTVAVARLNFVRPVIEFPTAASACAQLTLGFVSQTDPRATATDTTVALYNRACCLDQSYALDVNRRIATAVADGSVLSLTVAESTLAQYAPVNTFRLCVVTPSLQSCADLGTMSIGTSECSTPEPTPNQTADLRMTLPPGQLIGGAPPDTGDEGVVEISIIGAIFFILLLVLIALCIVCARRRRLVIPPDEGEVEEPPTGEWRDTFDVLFEANRTKAPKLNTLHSMLHVPVDMKLNTCLEVPLEVHQAIHEEALERRDIEASEAFVFERLLMSSRIEHDSVVQQSALAERTALAGAVVGFWEKQFGNFMDVEEEARDVIKALEEEQRLDVAHLERNDWRHAMEDQSEQIQRGIQREERWRSRKRRLMQSSAAMMGHLDPAGARYDSPRGAGDATGAASRVPERTSVLETRMTSAPRQSGRGEAAAYSSARSAPWREDQYAEQSKVVSPGRAPQSRGWQVLTEAPRATPAPNVTDIPGSLASPGRGVKAATPGLAQAPRGTSLDTVDAGVHVAPARPGEFDNPLGRQAAESVPRPGTNRSMRSDAGGYSSITRGSAGSSATGASVHVDERSRGRYQRAEL